jgi:hypothetical protein
MSRYRAGERGRDEGKAEYGALQGRGMKERGLGKAENEPLQSRRGRKE